MYEFGQPTQQGHLQLCQAEMVTDVLFPLRVVLKKVRIQYSTEELCPKGLDSCDRLTAT